PPRPSTRADFTAYPARERLRDDRHPWHAPPSGRLRLRQDALPRRPHAERLRPALDVRAVDRRGLHLVDAQGAAEVLLAAAPPLDPDQLLEDGVLRRRDGDADAGHVVRL